MARRVLCGRPVRWVCCSSGLEVSKHKGRGLYYLLNMRALRAQLWVVGEVACEMSQRVTRAQPKVYGVPRVGSNVGTPMPCVITFRTEMLHAPCRLHIMCLFLHSCSGAPCTVTSPGCCPDCVIQGAAALGEARGEIERLLGLRLELQVGYECQLDSILWAQIGLKIYMLLGLRKIGHDTTNLHCVFQQF